MSTMTKSAASPIFILSQARTGSTLFRYLIDAHPEVCCPPELALGRLCRTLAYTLGLTLGLAEDSEQTVWRAVRSHVDAVMNEYCVAKGKRRWCDKSTNNVVHAELLRDVFPDAQFICLHRNCLDVVYSLMELFRFGYPGRYGELVARSPHNVVDALIDVWVEETERLLAFEKANPSECLRVTYEEFVSTPESTAARLFSFLRLPFQPTMLAAMFTEPHDAGPGDVKIRFTSSILSGRVGRGDNIPRAQISSDRLVAMNRLQAVLGYEPAGDQGGVDIQQALQSAAAVTQRRRQKAWG